MTLAPLALAAALAAGGPAPAPAPADRLDLVLDTSEADAVLALLDLRAAGREPADADWARLFATDPYRRLQAREAAFKRPLTDEAMKAYVRSPELLAQREPLRAALAAWKRADLRAAAGHAFAYLPPEARIRARVFPVLKPRTNSFVFQTRTDPQIFLFLDPAAPALRFARTVAHELHHVGLASLGDEQERRTASLPAAAREAAAWTGAFGEGLAVLASAGGPGGDPQAGSEEDVVRAWEQGKVGFAEDLRAVDAFLTQVATGALAGDAADARGGDFYGVQGPWYTVGYRMAVEIERRDGREAVIACARDPRLLLARWNALAAADPALPRWSGALLDALGVGGAPTAAPAPRPPAP